jgi:hypothetical protein
MTGEELGILKRIFDLLMKQEVPFPSEREFHEVKTLLRDAKGLIAWHEKEGVEAE